MKGLVLLSLIALFVSGSAFAQDDELNKVLRHSDRVVRLKADSSFLFLAPAVGYLGLRARDGSLSVTEALSFDGEAIHVQFDSAFASLSADAQAILVARRVEAVKHLYPRGDQCGIMFNNHHLVMFASTADARAAIADFRSDARVTFAYLMADLDDSVR